MKNWALLLAGWLLLMSAAVHAEPMLSVAMHDKGRSTFYVPVTVDGWDTRDFLVDTGSTYTIVGTSVMQALRSAGKARYLRSLTGYTADGRRLAVRVYQVTRLRIGEGCELHNVEVAVLPTKSRPILGLSALKHASPFRFSVEPPSLELSGCGVNLTASAN